MGEEIRSEEQLDMGHFQIPQGDREDVQGFVVHQEPMKFIEKVPEEIMQEMLGQIKVNVHDKTEDDLWFVHVDMPAKFDHVAGQKQIREVIQHFFKEQLEVDVPLILSFGGATVKMVYLPEEVVQSFVLAAEQDRTSDS